MLLRVFELQQTTRLGEVRQWIALGLFLITGHRRALQFGNKSFFVPCKNLFFFTPKECFNPNAIFSLHCYTCLLKSQKVSETSTCWEFFYLCVCIGTWRGQQNLSNYTKSDKNRTCHFGVIFYPNALEFVNNPTTKTQTWNAYQKQWPTFDALLRKKERKLHF